MANLYRDCVGAVIVNSNDRVLAGKRSNTANNLWQMPQGGVNDNEDEYDAIVREVFEEIGIEGRNLYYIATTDGYHSYDLPVEYRDKTEWGTKYIGQRQRWFLFKFMGDNDNIALPFIASNNSLDLDSSGSITYPHDYKKNTTNEVYAEFCGYCWMNSTELVESVVSFKVNIYKSVFEEFSTYIPNLAN